MISIWLDKLKLTDEDANDWEIKSKALALLLVLLLPCKNAKYNGTIYRCLSSPFLKAESEPRSWLSSQRTDGSSSSSKTQFFNCSSSSELIGTTFTITNAERLFLRTWNFYKCLKVSQFLGGNFFWIFLDFLEFCWFTLHFRPFQAKKKFFQIFSSPIHLVYLWISGRSVLLRTS